jgi:hypothetical protein
VPPTAGSGETMNGFGTTTSNAEGATGTFAGQPVYIDANILSNDGVGLNQDRLIVAKFDDFYLWEGAIRFRALQEVLSGTLQVRLQMYNYVAFMPDRYPVGASIVVGTGLVSPSGY